jgi:hypothetical protein
MRVALLDLRPRPVTQGLCCAFAALIRDGSPLAEPDGYSSRKGNASPNLDEQVEVPDGAGVLTPQRDEIQKERSEREDTKVAYHSHHESSTRRGCTDKGHCRQRGDGEQRQPDPSHSLTIPGEHAASTPISISGGI